MNQKFEKTWRWFGPDDTITLDAIRQADVKGIVTALHHLPTGVVWPLDELEKRKEQIEDAGLTWSVVESIPVHEDIKRRTGDYQTYIDNYKTSIENLGKAGIPVLCYNFMPVLDWTRTDLDHEMSMGYSCLRFDETALAAFDLFILKRPGAEAEFSSSLIKDAKSYYKSLDREGIDELTRNIVSGLPGSEEGYTLEEFQAILDSYDGIGEQELRENLHAFLKEVAPVAEASGVRLAIHPDDPPFPLFGLPRVVSTESDAKGLLDVYDSPYNGLTFCTGSYGARADNDLLGMVKRLGYRFNFLHLRNIQREKGRSFHEALHLKGDVDMEKVIYLLIMEQERRHAEGRKDLKIPFRPDHGQNILRSLHMNSAPGYSYIGRLRGLAVLRGVEMGIRTALQIQREQESA